MDSLRGGLFGLLRIPLLLFTFCRIVFLIALNFGLEGMPVSGLDQSPSVSNFILLAFQVVAASTVAIIVAEEAAGEAQAVHLEAFGLVALADDGLLLIRFLVPEHYLHHLFLQQALLQKLLFALSSLTRHFVVIMLPRIHVRLLLALFGPARLLEFLGIVRIGAQQVSAHPFVAELLLCGLDLESKAFLLLGGAVVWTQKLRRTVGLSSDAEMGRALLLLPTDVLVNFADGHVYLDLLALIGGRNVNFELKASGFG